MKPALVLLALGLVGVSVVRAQQTTPATSSVQAQPQHKKIDPSKMRKVGRPPLSAQATGIHRLSTAQRAALAADKPLIPQMPAFAAVGKDGTATTATASAPQGHWLLLYRHADCIPCDRLMVALAASQSPTLKAGSSYVIVVDGAKPDALNKVRTAYPDLAEATWLSDSKKQAWAALKPTGSPMLYAMDGTQVAWKVAGTLGNPSRAEGLASSWLAAPSKASLIAANMAKVQATHPGAKFSLAPPAAAATGAK